MVAWQIESAALVLDDEHSLEERVVGDFAGTDVEDPADLGKVVEDGRLSLVLCDLLAHPPHLFGCRLSCPLFMDVDFVALGLGTVRPDLVDEVLD